MAVRREELSEKERETAIIASITNPETGETIEWSILGIDTDHVYSFSATNSEAMNNNERSD